MTTRNNQPPPAPASPAQEREALDKATAMLLTELAWLLPKGTDMRTHPVTDKLLAFRDAVVAAVHRPPPAPSEAAGPPPVGATPLAPTTLGAGLPPVGEPALDENRCSICGWPLREQAIAGCTRGNCSQRPWPERYYDPVRARREYGDRLPVERNPYRPDPRDAEITRLRDALAQAQRERSEAVSALDANWVTHQRVIAAEQRADAAEATLAQARAEVWREAAGLLRDAERRHDVMAQCAPVLRALADQMDQRAQSPAPPQETE